MSFSKRKSDRRKPDVRPLAASAEVCEARALLSADGAAVTVEEIVDTKSDDANTVDVENGDGEIVPEIAICEFVPEIAICTMLPLEQEFVSDGEGEVIKGEELLWTCGWPVDGEIVDALPVDEFVGDEEFVDITTLEDWDPSWAYRSFVVADDEVVDGEVADGEVADGDSEVIIEEEIVIGEEEFVDFIISLEDFEPWWVSRGVVIDEKFGTSDELDSLPEEGFDEDLIFYTTVVCERDSDGVEDAQDFLVDGEVVVGDSEEFVEITSVDVKDAEGTDGQEVIYDVLDGEFTSNDDLNDLTRFNVAPYFRSNFGPDRVMTTAVRGILTESAEASASEVMGPVAAVGSVAIPVSLPVVTVPVSVQLMPLAPAPVSIPVTSSSFRPLFEVEQELDTIGTLIAQLPEDSSVSSELTEVAAGSGLESGLGQTESDSRSSLDSGLEVLDTLLEGESTESDSDPPSEPTEVEVAPEETVTSTHVTTQVAEPAVVTAARPAYYSSERLTDRFMTEFAVNGFVG